MSDDNQAPQIAPADVASSAAPAPDMSSAQQQATLAQPSRLSSILKAVASTVSTGLAGIPDSGRSSFVTGLGEGTRSAQAAQKQAQDIKFKTFDDSVRAANLHNQDRQIQGREQEQYDTHESHQDTQHDWDEAHGIEYDTVPNTASAVTDHLKTQTSANGAASVPAGTHLSADGKSVLIPKQTDATQKGQMEQYKTFAPVLGLPSLPQGASFVPPRMLDALTHKMQGYDVSGNNITADKLPGVIASTQSQRDTLATSGGTPAQLKALDNIIGIYKSTLKADNDQQATIAKGKEAAKVAAETSPEAIAGAASKAGAIAKAQEPFKKDLQDNAAANKPKADSTELNAVAFDPNYQNPDGTKGGNVVMSKSDASAKGLQHYKADAGKVNSLVAGFNDVQNKLNMLADIANDPKRMGSVQAGVAAAMLAHGKGIEVGAFGTHADTSRINEALYAENVKSANQATRDYVTAMVGAHEAVTQLPRLQTFGQSSRMTQQQMEAAVNLLPHPGDGPMAQQKMVALQQMLDPLRKQVPHMPGAESMPSWLEKQGGAKPQEQSTPTPVGAFDPQNKTVKWTNGGHK